MNLFKEFVSIESNQSCKNSIVLQVGLALIETPRLSMDIFFPFCSYSLLYLVSRFSLESQ